MEHRHLKEFLKADLYIPNFGLAVNNDRTPVTEDKAPFRSSYWVVSEILICNCNGGAGLYKRDLWTSASEIRMHTAIDTCTCSPETM
jgi:hypothetical protein